MVYNNCVVEIRQNINNKFILKVGSKDFSPRRLYSHPSQCVGIIFPFCLCCIALHCVYLLDNWFTSTGLVVVDEFSHFWMIHKHCLKTTSNVSILCSIGVSNCPNVNSPTISICISYSVSVL